MAKCFFLTGVGVHPLSRQAGPRRQPGLEQPPSPAREKPGSFQPFRAKPLNILKTFFFFLALIQLLNEPLTDIDQKYSNSAASMTRQNLENLNQLTVLQKLPCGFIKIKIASDFF